MVEQTGDLVLRVESNRMRLIKDMLQYMAKVVKSSTEILTADSPCCMLTGHMDQGRIVLNIVTRPSKTGLPFIMSSDLLILLTVVGK